mmetsp:Transcript_9559/g.13992  ORF Transcript_9559/g.13992 Transcript_9559/m.13992 type:complete len:393 (-) Transcript_9559:108-1286(-)
MRVWVLLFQLLFLSMRSFAQGMVLVPSSLYQMALRPTFREMNFASFSSLEEAMTTVLIRTTESIHRESLRPKNISVVVQEYELLSSDDKRSQVSETVNFGLPTSIITFVVLGNYKKLSAATGTEFMDALVSNAFYSDTLKEKFIALLRSSRDESLNKILDTTIEKETASFITGDNFLHESAPSTETKLTVVDIILIVVSSLIFAIIACLAIIYWSEHYDTEADSRSTRSSMATSEKIDLSDHKSLHVQFSSRRNYEGMPKNHLNMCILDDISPTLSTNKTQTVIQEEKNEFLGPSFRDVSASSELFVESECFCSRWFGGTQQSFSVDDDDLFAVDVDGKLRDTVTRGSNKNGKNLRGKSIAEWTKSIRVIPSEYSTSVSVSRIVSGRDNLSK